MAENERNYVVPLRQYWRMAARYKRAKRAVNGLRRFVIRHMKVDKVLIGKELNELILERGQRKPPARVQVTVIKEDNVGKVNVIGVPYSKEILKVDKKSSLKKTSEKAEVKEEHKHEGHEHKHEEKKEHEHKEEKPKAKKGAKKKESSEEKK